MRSALKRQYTSKEHMQSQVHTQLTMPYYIWPFRYDIINVSLRFSQCYFRSVHVSRLQYELY